MTDKKLTSPIPKDTLEVHNLQIENINLLLNKYLNFCIIDKEYQIKELLEPSKVKQVNFLPIIKNGKNFELALKRTNKYILKYTKYIIQKNFEKNIKTYREKLLNPKKTKEINKFLEKIHKRQKKICDSEILLTTKSRLVIGLGLENVLETSLKLHYIYGIPYIPASAIKGVLKAYRIWKLADWNIYKFFVVENLIENYEIKKFNKLKKGLIENLKEKNFDKKFKEIDSELSKEDIKKIRQKTIDFIDSISKKEIEKIVEIFGNQKQKGKLIFLDAYTEKFEGFDIDIVNSHFPEYYDENKNAPPEDWQNPIPITFLTIPESTTFRFYFKNSNVYDSCLEHDLKEAFLNIGIGAKTSLGYGILV